VYLFLYGVVYVCWFFMNDVRNGLSLLGLFLW